VRRGARPDPSGIRLVGFMVARFGLGLASRAIFLHDEVIAEWFPQRQRGSPRRRECETNIGAVLAPLIVPLVVAADGSHWQIAFCSPPCLAVLWLFGWWRMYRSPAEHRG